MSMRRRCGHVRPARCAGLGRRALVAASIFMLSPSWADTVSDAGNAAPSLKDVETVTVMPIVLSRGIEVSDRAELQGNVDKMLLRKLALKGYVLDRPRGWSLPQNWTVEGLQPLAPAALAALLPAQASHVALLFVERIDEASGTVSSSATVAVAVRIVEVSSGRVLWHAQSTGEYSEDLHFSLTLGPIAQLAMMAFTPDKYFALERAFGSLFDKLPGRP
jgi:hypothetical protein